MGDGEERNAAELDALDARIGVKDDVEQQMAALVSGETGERPRDKPPDRSSLIHTRPWIVLPRFG